MNLSKSNFFKRVFLYKTCANGEAKEARGYGYESAGTLYDVNLYQEGVQYRINGKTVQRGPVHKAIAEHFKIDA